MTPNDGDEPTIPSSTQFVDALDGLTEGSLVGIWRSVIDVGEPHKLYNDPAKDILLPRVGYSLRITKAAVDRSDVAGVVGILVYNIVVGQPFSDCNHRTAFACMITLLEAAGCSLVVTEEIAADFIRSISDVWPDGEARVARWIRASFAPSSE